MMWLKNSLFVSVCPSNTTVLPNRNGLYTYFQYKCDILYLKAKFKFLDLFYSSYRKPGSLFLMKPADSLMFVCVCVCLQSGRWVSYLQRSHTHPLLCLINTILNSSLHTCASTHSLMHKHGHTHAQALQDTKGILSMSNFTLHLGV